MFKFISIRTKIFVTLILLTTASLTGLMLSSRNLVEKDKTASLFETNLNSLNTKAAFLRSIFQQWGVLASTLSLYLDETTHSFGSVGTSLADSNADLKLALCVLENKAATAPATAAAPATVPATGTVPPAAVNAQAPAAPNTAAAPGTPAAAVAPGTAVPPAVLPAKTGPLVMAFNAKPDFASRQREFTDLLLQKAQGGLKDPIFELDTPSATARYFFRIGSKESPQSALCTYVFTTARLKGILIGEGASQFLLVQANGDPALLIDPDVTAKWVDIRDQFDFNGNMEVTKMVDSPEGRYLGGKVPVQSGLALIGLVPEAIIKQTLHALTNRALTVFLLSLFVVAILGLVFSHSLTWNLAQLGAAVQKVAQGDFTWKLELRAKDETALLAQSFRKTSEEILRLLEETAEKSRMESELRTAKAVQDTLFPESNAELTKMSIRGYYRSASECGGDWWYYFEQGPWLYFVIADATGHGAPAALITACARAVTSLVSTTENLSLETWVRGLNRAIFETSKGSILMTALIARFNMKDGSFEWINCSHEFPLVRNDSGEWDFLLTETCSRLGEKPDYNPKIEKATLSPNQQIMFFTDGLFDVPNPEKKAFGERNVIRTMKKGGDTAEEGRDGLVAKLDSYSKGSELPDDVTFVFMQRRA